MDAAKKVIDYDIPGSNTQEGLIDLVKDYIRDGWQPFHGPFMREEKRGVDDETEIWIYQPMIKYEE